VPDLRTLWRRAGASLAGLYVLGAAMWSLPAGAPFRQDVLGLVGTPFLWLGLQQNWGMFAPNPRSEDLYTTALLTYAGGTVRHLNLTEMRRYDYGRRYARERWRKLYNEALVDPAVAPYLPGVARYLARTHWSPELGRVVRVDLVRHSRSVDLRDLPRATDPSPGAGPEVWTEEIVYGTDVPEEAPDAAH
jgi:hypothetical protein